MSTRTPSREYRGIYREIARLKRSNQRLCRALLGFQATFCHCPECEHIRAVVGKEGRK